MDENLGKRVANLEKENIKLKKVIDQLARRLAQVEQQSRRAYHAARENEIKANSLNVAVRELSRQQRKDY